jgi:fibronectin-binding autotransporter adhesin
MARSSLPYGPRISDEEYDQRVVALHTSAARHRKNRDRELRRAELNLALDHLSASTIGRIWRAFDLKPHRTDTFKLSNGVLNAGSLSMTGGTISTAGPESLLVLSGNIGATSSPAEPAAVSTPVELKTSPTITVTPGAAGTAPELRLTGVISEFGGSYGITKAGAGTLLTSAANTYTGATIVSAGTVVAEGTQAGAFSVGQNGTLTGAGAIGATSVEGILAPLAPGLTTGSLGFGPLGRLDETLTSIEPGTVPSAIVKGTVTINPSAALDLVVAPGTVLPHGSTALVIDDKGSEPIAGQFAGIPNGFVLPTAEGVPLAVSYAGGDGNDLSLTAANVAP